jgi:hypothetical protein
MARRSRGPERGDEEGRLLLEAWGRQVRARRAPLDAWPSMSPLERMRAQDAMETPAPREGSSGHRIYEGHLGDGLLTHLWLVGDERGRPGQPEAVRLAVRYWFADRAGLTVEAAADALGITRQRMYELRNNAKLAVRAFADGYRSASARNAADGALGVGHSTRL